MRRRTLFLSLLFLVACSAHAKPVVTGVTYDYNTGPLPPQYYYESTLALAIDHPKDEIFAKFMVQHDYKPSAKMPRDEYKGSFGKEWCDELMGIVAKIRLCKEDERMKNLVGGSHRRITLNGENLQEFAWSDMVNHKELTFGPANSCKQEWWDEWSSFSRDIVRALTVMNKRGKTPVYRYLKVDNGKELLIEIRPDYVTRTAKVFINGKESKTLDRQALVKFESLLYGPNYYADGNYKKAPKERNGEYIDRGEGNYYSFDGGIQDAYGKEGAVKRLRIFIEGISKNPLMRHCEEPWATKQSP